MNHCQPVADVIASLVQLLHALRKDRAECGLRLRQVGERGGRLQFVPTVREERCSPVDQGRGLRRGRSGRVGLLPGVRHRLEALDVGKVAALALEVAGLAGLVCPLLNLGDPRLVVGAE